jgi:hypothetical protein
LRQMGVDEMYMGKKQKFLSVVCNLETGEPLWFGQERKKERLDGFFQTELGARQRRGIQAACVIAEKKQQIADAVKQIADLERQLSLRKQNSTNSFKPPSSEGLAWESRRRGRRKKSWRKWAHLQSGLLQVR